MNPSSKRIVMNTLVTYGRSLFALLVGLFTARWVLLSLGEVDFGLFGVVGGLIALCAVFNALLTSATTRFFAVAIGEARNQDRESGEENCRRWFNVAVMAHGVLAVVLVAVGYPIGVWAIEHWLTIPSERIADCIWVFRFSCLTAFVNMVNVPFNGMFVAKQEIAEQSLYSSFQTVFMFLIAGYMILHPGDWLFGYAALMSANSIIPELVICLRACMKYRECRLDFRQMCDGNRLLQMIRFAFYQTFTGIGYIFLYQGMSIFVNKMFGPVLNASMGIAIKVRTQATSLTLALENAFRPAVATAWGRKDFAGVSNLAFRATRYALFCGLFFVVPLLVGVDEVLVLWLKTPPPSAGLLCSLLLIAFVVDMLGCGHGLAIDASGRIAGYQCCLGICWMLALPIAFFLVRIHMGIASVGFALIISFVLGSAVKIGFAWKIVGMSVARTAFSDLRACGCGALGVWCGRLVRSGLPDGLIWTFLAMAVASFLFLTSFYFIAASSDEREFVVGKARGIFGMMQ